jgi:hypothetical protein
VDERAQAYEIQRALLPDVKTGTHCRFSVDDKKEMVGLLILT